MTDYDRYIRTDELLALQKPQGQLACHDELQFQVVHQAAELWMKLVAHELVHAAARLGADEVAEATYLLRRVGRVQRLLLEQLDLLDTMAPRDYMAIRAVLGNGSGQESPGFKTLLRLPDEVVWPAVAALLLRRGVTVRDVYARHEQHTALYHPSM